MVTPAVGPMMPVGSAELFSASGPCEIYLLARAKTLGLKLMVVRLLLALAMAMASRRLTVADPALSV